MFDIYIVQVIPANGFGADYFYCYHNLDNARAKIAELAEKFDLYLHGPDLAARYGNFDRNYNIAEIKMSKECFKD